ncbi:hypothetical protein B7463_g6197, partial [Scytalidium lignicola]
MATPITRVTLFKIADPVHQQRVLDQYKTMLSKAKKNGKPYILNVKAGPAYADQRSQGFTIVAVSQFASVEDMVYYDNECQAHAELKAVAKGVHEGLMMAYFQNVVDEA